MSGSEMDHLLAEVGSTFLRIVFASANLGHEHMQDSVDDYIARPEYPPHTLSEAAQAVVLDALGRDFNPAQVLERHPWVANYGTSALDLIVKQTGRQVAA